MNEDVKLKIFTALSLLIIIFGIVVIAVDGTTITPVGYFVKITSDLIRDITSDLVRDITALLLKITGKPTLTASFEVIAEAGPYLSKNIPNQTWNEDTNISINLSLYFTDPNNDDLSFAYNDSVSKYCHRKGEQGSIELTINNDTNIANLTPDKNWYGIGYIVFIVTDGSFQNQSNNITLNVTSVNDAPIFNGSNISIRSWDEDENLTHYFNISTYFSDIENDSLTFTATGNSSIKIEITNGNVSLIPNKNWNGTEYILFTISDGINTTYSNNITLTVNSMPEIQTITEAGFSGLTTDLSGMNSTQLKNITNFTLEKTEYGFLRFRENVNLSIDINFSNPNHINVTNNLIFINITLFPQLNKSAEIKFYNLTFTNPQILKDGEVCPSTICTELSYSEGTFFFNVSHFSTYTTRETPVVEREMPPAAAEAVAAGGAGGGAARAATFRLSKDLIKVVVSPGIKKTVSFNIKNLGTISRDYTIEIEGVKEFVTIKDKSFSLEPTQSKDVEVIIEAPEDIDLDVYTGSIIVKSALISQVIKVISEIQSLYPLFDVDVDVLKTHKKTSSGGEVLAQVRIYDLRELGEVDVNVYYIIKDMKGNKIIADKDIITVDAIAEFIKSMTLPEIDPGSYVFAVKVVYQGSIGTSTDVFEVVPITELPTPIKVFAPINMLIWLAGLLIIVLILLVFLDIIRKINLIRSIKVRKVILKKKKEKEKEEKKKKKLSLLKKWMKKKKRERKRRKKEKEKEERRKRERKHIEEERKKKEKERERRKEERRKHIEEERKKEEKEREHRKEERRKYREMEMEREEIERERKRIEKEHKEKEKKRREKKKEREIEEEEKNIEKYKIIKEKLNKNLGLLTKAYESKYISKNAYLKDRDKLKKKIKKINKKFFLFFLLALIFVPIVHSELINLNVEVNEVSKQIHPGDEVFVEISLINIAINREDITIEYYIIDKNGNIIDSESETVLLTTRIDRVRSLELPEDIKPGRYSFVVKVIYKDEIIGKASDAFEVIEIEKPAVIDNRIYVYIIVILIIFFILFMIYEYMKFKQIEKLIKKVNARNLKFTNKKKRRIIKKK